MKIILISIAAIVAIGFVAYIVMAVMSQKAPNDLGLQNGQLPPCPDTPNCVCSESHTQGDKQHFIEAIPGDKATWDRLKQEVQSQGGVIQKDKNNYIHATFSSSIFRYVDDVELRFDEANKLIHIRSASRMGKSDFGVNRARVENLTQSL